MGTVSNTPRPGYVWDSTDNVWYPIGVGNHNHSEIAKTIVDAKGDLIVGTANDTVARQAVGTDGQMLVADSTQTNGIGWASQPFVAGKNKIINGDFNIWQRGTSFSNPNNVYTADRWVAGTDATCTVSQQSFTVGTAPVSGYEGTYFYRGNKSSGGTYLQVNQKIEDVRAFANQTITISFWAKADSAITLAVQGYQNFGSGGSTQVTALNTSVTLTTSWARYSVTATLPSISGKTIGTSSYLMLPYFLYNSSSAVILDLWGIQVETGSIATPFTTATGTIQGELAACQRYYQRIVDGNSQWISTGANYSAAQFETVIRFIVAMRTAPTLVVSTGTDYYSISRNGGTDLINSLTLYQATTQTTLLYNNSEVSGTAGHAGNLFSNNASSSIAFSSEL